MAITINSSEAAVAATPYLLGFDPEDSLVLIFAGSHRPQMTMRVDLPPMPDLGWLQALLSGLGAPLPERAVLVLYANDAPADLACALGNWVYLVLSPLVEVVDVLLVHQGLVSHVGVDAQFAQEEPLFLESVANHPIVAECIAAGLSKVGQRADLAKRLAAVTDQLSEEVAHRLGRPVRGKYEHRRTRLERRATQILNSADDLLAGDIADIGLACRDCHVRDPLISIILKQHAHADIALAQVRTRLTYALVHLPRAFAGPVAATLALFCWADGDGAAALVAVDRALQADPENSLAPLVEQALQHGLPPTTWADLTHDIPLDVLRGRQRSA